MALSSGMGPRRTGNFPLRLNKRELARFKALARAAELSMAEYARAKIFDIPFENLGGRPRKDQPKPAQETPAPSSD